MKKAFIVLFCAFFHASIVPAQIVFHIDSAFVTTIDDFSTDDINNFQSQEIENIIYYGPRLHVYGRIENTSCHDVVLSAFGDSDYITYSYKISVTIDDQIVNLPYEPADYLAFYFPSKKGSLYGKPIEYSIIKQGEIVEGVYIDALFLGNSVFSRLLNAYSNQNDDEVRKHNIEENKRLSIVSKRLLPSLNIQLVIKDSTSCSKHILRENGLLSSSLKCNAL